MTVGLIALFSGCAMCAHPFDYCGPTVTGRCSNECDPNAPRAGSILAGSVGPTMIYSDAQFSSADSSEERLLEDLMEAAPRELTGPPTPAIPATWTARTSAQSATR